MALDIHMKRYRLTGFHRSYGDIIIEMDAMDPLDLEERLRSIFSDAWDWKWCIEIGRIFPLAFTG